jgi:hypothetical protein
MKRVKLRAAMTYPLKGTTGAGRIVHRPCLKTAGVVARRRVRESRAVPGAGQSSIPATTGARRLWVFALALAFILIGLGGGVLQRGFEIRSL